MAGGRGRRPGIALAATAAALALLAPHAHACSCAQPDPPRQLERSDGAIIGSVVAVRRQRGPASGEVGTPARYWLRYRIQAVLKARKRLRRGEYVWVGSAGATCDLPRARGRRYGVFLGRREGRWAAGLCDVVSPRQMRAGAEGRRAAGQVPCAR